MAFDYSTNNLGRKHETVLDQVLQPHITLPHVQMAISQLTKLLSNTLRSWSCEQLVVKIIYCKSLRFVNFNKMLNDNHAITTFMVNDSLGYGLVISDYILLMNLIDACLGSNVWSPTMTIRPYTIIEQAINEKIVSSMLINLNLLFRESAASDLTFTNLRLTTEIANIHKSADILVVLKFGVLVGNYPYELLIAIPYLALELIEYQLQQLSAQKTSQLERDWQRDLLQRMQNVNMSVEARINDYSKKWSDIVGLRVGDILHLKHQEHQAIDLMCDSTRICTGQLGKIRNKVAIGIADLDSGK